MFRHAVRAQPIIKFALTATTDEARHEQKKDRFFADLSCPVHRRFNRRFNRKISNRFCHAGKLFFSSIGLGNTGKLLEGPALVIWTVRLPRILMAVMTAPHCRFPELCFNHSSGIHWCRHPYWG